MKPEIKERIDKIKSGQVPEGYKKTKVGIVPVEWKVTKLNHYLYVNNDKNEELTYGKEDVFSISGELGIVNQIELLGRSYAGASVAPYGIVYPNDVVYTKSPLKSSPYGIIKTNLSSKTGIVSTLYAIFHCKDNVCPKYVEDYFSLDNKLNNYLYPIVNIGAKHDMKISDENSLKGYVVFPPLPEQEKIAKILGVQDKIIDLQQKKIDEYKKLKKAMLQRMFPKKGENVPEIRFPEFTDPWEQRKFSDGVSEVGDGLHGTPTYCDDGDIYFVNGNNLIGGIIVINSETKTVDESQQSVADKSLDDNTILMSINGTIGNLAYYSGEKLMLGKSAAYIKVSEFDKKFVYAYLQAPSVRAYFMDSLTGTTIKNLGLKAIREMRIIVPQDVEEQRKIGEYFSNLDNLITLHQRKLDEYKTYKKSLMQLLLTGIVRCK